MLPFVALKWNDLGGILLHNDIVDSGYLERIEKDNPKNIEECCRKMLIKWLETDKDASWEQLITALQSSSIQLKFLAERIKRKLQKGESIVSVDYIRMFILAT